MTPLPQPLAAERSPGTAVERALRAALAGRPGDAPPLVLAVSGGVDSMVLLDAAAREAREHIAAVASFDHGTGAAAREAQRLVAREARRRALPVVLGRAETAARDEAGWRRARWRFLREVSERCGGVVVTAHTEDDQLETVVMRALRGAGARGLAALEAPAVDVLRPLLGVGRAAIRDHARARGVAWLDDPTNRSPRHVRNRVRHDLLPALLAARPALRGELLALAREAAAWRAEVERFVDAHVQARRDEAGVLHVAAADVVGYDSATLAVLWPALAARVGTALDHRGTRRLAEFTIEGAIGAVMPLSGGWEVARRRDRFELRRRGVSAPRAAEAAPLCETLRWGRWRFTRADDRTAGGTGSSTGQPWSARLPADEPLMVRPWRPGDRMRAPGGLRRRVRRFFRDAGIAGADRAGWPVVVAGDEVVWIPGVRRSDAATERSGRPGLLFHCDFDDR